MKKFTGGAAVGLFDADKEHLHHRLLSRGWSQRKVAEVLQVGAAALTILCFLPLLIGSSGWALVLPVMFIGGVFFLRHVTSVELIQSGNAIQLALRGPGTGRKRRVAYMALDVVLLSIAWGLAFFTSAKVSSNTEAWAFLLSYGVAQWLGAVGVLHLVGTYRIIWRRALLVEMATVFWTLTALGLGVGILVSVSSEGIQSAWTMMTMALLGSLLSSIAVLVPRALGPYVSQLAIRSVDSDTGSKGNRVLVYGAGDLGVLFLDYLASRTRSREMAELVGFVDDDQQACGRVLRGFRILGGGADITRIVQERGIDEVVVAIDGLSPEFISDLQVRIQSVHRKVSVKRWSCGYTEIGVDSKDEDLEVAREV